MICLFVVMLMASSASSAAAASAFALRSVGAWAILITTQPAYGPAPGLYSLIHLQVRRTSPVISIPSQAVIFNQGGLQKAVVSDGKVELRKIDLELDNGATCKGA
jgi:hypothetical protein